MKKRLLQFGSFLMAFVVLFVSMGWDIKFHYCTEDHHLMGSFSDAAAECVHCMGHHHGHEDAEEALPHDVVQFSAKCCCDDFDSIIQFTDNYVFSADKHFHVNLPAVAFQHYDIEVQSPDLQRVFSIFSPRKILTFLSGRERTVFFSSLRVDPLVF
jgi:hypothetical protein